ncbi:hypothetical protein IV36_GL001944 [Liquorilactobacillus mali]|uniref:Uncharacterized protein n=1 Tax=Liquorilactobacillus mali TaxID=1618 RepID=A0A0R2FRL4_9LACO|nr:hypothetical protein IV36_GL001944 [Liquorilactobacillus mali]
MENREMDKVLLDDLLNHSMKDNFFLLLSTFWILALRFLLNIYFEKVQSYGYQET